MSEKVDEMSDNEPIEKPPKECPYCGREVSLGYGPDPYASDLYDDDTPVWMCAECAHERAMDV